MFPFPSAVLIHHLSHQEQDDSVHSMSLAKLKESAALVSAERAGAVTAAELTGTDALVKSDDAIGWEQLVITAPGGLFS